MAKYSVIIPVYKAEKTLHRCVDSLLDQKYPDVEIILVNDGSPDGSGAICEEYADRFPSVRYLNKENGGVSTARNAGLDIATGEYVLFVDSDDYTTCHYFEVLDKLGAAKNYDCIFFSLENVEGEKHTPEPLVPFESKTEPEAVTKFAESLYRKYLNKPTNKRYKRSIIEKYGLRFPTELNIGEDKVFCLNYVMHCRDCFVSPEVLYYVSLDNKESLSRRIRKNTDDQYRKMDEKIQRILQTADIPQEYRQQYIVAENLIQLRAVYSNAKRMHLTGEYWRKRRAEIKKMCQENNARNVPLPDGTFSRLLQIPVRLKLVTVIDLMGWYLAR